MNVLTSAFADGSDDSREYLQSELGTTDVRELVEMVRSLETQLVDLYREKEEEGQR